MVEILLNVNTVDNLRQAQYLGILAGIFSDLQSPSLKPLYLGFHISKNLLNLLTKYQTYNDRDPNWEIRPWDLFYGTGTCFIGDCLELIDVKNRGLGCRDLEAGLSNKTQA